MGEIAVLRLGHRIQRDKRITTHVALVARAFGAQRIFISTKDEKIESSIKKICEKFGGSFEIQTGVKYNHLIKNWSGTVVHLTMYGDRFDTAIKKINKKKDVLVIVGAEKIPPEIYQMADFNISVGNQPHSEVAALALFLDSFTNRVWLEKKFNGKIQILPSQHNKQVIEQK